MKRLYEQNAEILNVKSRWYTSLPLCFKTLNSAAHVPLPNGYFYILNGGSGLTIHVPQFWVSIWTQNMGKCDAPVNNVMNFRVP